VEYRIGVEELWYLKNVRFLGVSTDLVYVEVGGITSRLEDVQVLEVTGA
jgi:hypothetical protein